MRTQLSVVAGSIALCVLVACGGSGASGAPVPTTGDFVADQPDGMQMVMSLFNAPAGDFEAVYTLTSDKEAEAGACSGKIVDGHIDATCSDQMGNTFTLTGTGGGTGVNEGLNVQTSNHAGETFTCRPAAALEYGYPDYTFSFSMGLSDKDGGAALATVSKVKGTTKTYSGHWKNFDVIVSDVSVGSHYSTNILVYTSPGSTISLVFKDFVPLLLMTKQGTSTLAEMVEPLANPRVRATLAPAKVSP